MAAELQTMAQNPAPLPHKRKFHGKSKKPNKKLKPISKPKPPSHKLKRLYKKRAKAYNSDDEEDEEKMSDEEVDLDAEMPPEGSQPANSDDEQEDQNGDRPRPGSTRFIEGCRAFKNAFTKIMEKKIPNDPLGPILSANKKLVAEKLAEEEIEHTAKGEAKKEKHLAAEKGHVKPASFLDAKERFLINTATKGVVKLFNAVNKAQNPQRGLNPSKSKDAKELAKRRKRTFLSELQKSTTDTVDTPFRLNSSKGMKSADMEKNDEPGWAPLRDTYMVTDSKLMNWDKLPNPSAVVNHGNVPVETSSDED